MSKWAEEDYEQAWRAAQRACTDNGADFEDQIRAALDAVADRAGREIDYATAERVYHSMESHESGDVVRDLLRALREVVGTAPAAPMLVSSVPATEHKPFVTGYEFTHVGTAPAAQPSAREKLGKLREALDEEPIDDGTAHEVVAELGVDVPALAARLRATVAAQPSEVSGGPLHALTAYAKDIGSNLEQMAPQPSEPEQTAGDVLSESELMSVEFFRDCHSGLIPNVVKTVDRLVARVAELEATIARVRELTEEWKTKGWSTPDELDLYRKQAAALKDRP